MTSECFGRVDGTARGEGGLKHIADLSVGMLGRANGLLADACRCRPALPRRSPSISILLAPVYGWFTEGFDTADLKEAKALLAELA
jgi:predicted ATPase